MTTNDTTTTPLPEDLGQTCLGHLRREIDCLSRINDSLLTVRAALVAINPDALTQALEGQHRAALEMARVRAERLELRQVIAQSLTVSSADATVRQLADRLPPPCSTLLHAAREELRQLALLSRRLAEGNSLLTRNWSRVIDRVFEQITGRPTPAERYSAQGTKDGPPPTSLFQARC